jgi:hypothetical protein
MTIGKRYIRQDLGTFSTYSHAYNSTCNWIKQDDGNLWAERKPGQENLFPAATAKRSES